MEKDYEKELQENVLYQFLRSNNGCKVYWISQGDEMCAYFHSNCNSVYFRREDGTYRRVDMSSEIHRQHNSKSLLQNILRVTRVEKEFDNQWLPVWTIADGFVKTDFCNYVYLKERHYTFKELEQLITEIKTLKKMVANLKVY